MIIKKDIFRAYDIRGLYPQEIDESAAYKIGLAYAQLIKPKTVVVGCDVRSGNASMKQEIIRALTESGVAVIDIGEVPTDFLYFTVGHYGYDGGIMASASHNPDGYGGIKMVAENVRPVFAEYKMPEIAELVLSGELKSPGKTASVTQKDCTSDYFDFILSFINVKKLKPQKIVANANFGLNGQILNRLVAEKGLPLEVMPLNFVPDGTFPKGRPDPMVPENRAEFLALAAAEQVDFGIAWDGDGDRCFFCDSHNNFFEACYITCLLVEKFLAKHPGAKTLYDVRYIYAIKAAAEEHGGVAIPTRIGRSFIMDIMRREDVVFSGESSAHYYFRDNFYCDNGIIPFLLIWEMLSESGKTLTELLLPYTSRFFVSGEFNATVADIPAKIEAAKAKYADGEQDFIDGVSVTYPHWRFNLRPSNTEPLIRCNVEGDNAEIVTEKKAELAEFLAS